MFDWIGIITAGLWPFIMHMSLASLAMAACAAWAVWGPFGKTQAIYAGVAIFMTTSAYVVGVKDGEYRVQSKWDKTRITETKQAEDDRAAIEHNLCSTPKCLCNDPNNRDRGKC